MYCQRFSIKEGVGYRSNTPRIGLRGGVAHGGCCRSARQRLLSNFLSRCPGCCRRGLGEFGKNVVTQITVTGFPLARRRRRRTYVLVSLGVASGILLHDVHNAWLIRAGVMIFFMTRTGETTLLARALKLLTDRSLPPRASSHPHQLRISSLVKRFPSGRRGTSHWMERLKLRND